MSGHKKSKNITSAVFFRE